MVSESVLVENDLYNANKIVSFTSNFKLVVNNIYSDESDPAPLGHAS